MPKSQKIFYNNIDVLNFDAEWRSLCSEENLSSLKCFCRYYDIQKICTWLEVTSWPTRMLKKILIVLNMISILTIVIPIVEGDQIRCSLLLLWKGCKIKFSALKVIFEVLVHMLFFPFQNSLLKYSYICFFSFQNSNLRARICRSTNYHKDEKIATVQSPAPLLANTSFLYKLVSTRASKNCFWKIPLPWTCVRYFWSHVSSLKIFIDVSLHGTEKTLCCHLLTRNALSYNKSVMM